MEPFDLIADDYQRVHSANPHQLEAIAELAQHLPPRANVLDLGCGTGLPTARLLAGQGHRVIGVDTAVRMLELARAQVPEAQFVLGDMRHLSFSPNEFDAVTAYFSLLMLSRADMAALLTEVRAWLRRGGLLSFSLVEFDADSVEVEFMGTTFQASGYTEAQLPAVLEHAGYEVVSLRTVDHAPIEGPSEAQVFCLARPLENR